MKLVIKSETDSRVCLYPILRCLYSYGTICIISQNPALYRLLSDDVEDGGFRNIRVIVEPSGNIELAMEEDDIYEGKYDFIIYDNMDVPEFDAMIILLTNRISEAYLQDILYIVGEPHTYILRVGNIIKPKPEKGAKKPKPEKSAKPKPEKKAKPKHGKKGEEEPEQEETVAEEPEVQETVEQKVSIPSGTTVDSLLQDKPVDTGFNEDGSYINKWRIDKSDAEILNDKLKEAGSLSLPFPKFQDIEDLESLYILPTLDSKQAKIYYDILKDWINVDQRQFMKGVSSKDEGGSFIGGANIG